MFKRKKKKWSQFYVSKIKLNPEQAVLSCCDSTTRNSSDGFGNCSNNRALCDPVGSGGLGYQS
jgi:hypothetical protein